MPIVAIKSGAMAISLDEVDVRLLEALQRNADRTNVELARLVDLSTTATLHRVRRLKESGVIAAIAARLNPDVAGFPLRVYVQLTVARHTEAAEKRLDEVIQSLPQVTQGDWVAGETDALLTVTARNLEELQQVLLALSSRGGATRVTTLLRLREIKPPSPLPLEATSRGARAR
jgi:Lrp/AsnC family transcriptional regulator, leucine-responsive regulatory protein